MALSADYKFALVAQETLDSITGAAATRIDYSSFEISGRLNATSTPPITKACYTKLTLTGATSGTLDLTALPAAVSGTQTMLGLKLQALRIAVTGTGNFTLTEGATNGYAIKEQVVGPGEALMQLFADRLADVATGDKTLDYTSSGSCVVNLSLLFG
jgi:hypothetical protein